MAKKYYWLKLKDDFFERDEIKIIESQKNGKDYINFYLKLLLKSVKSSGELRFRDSIPYNLEMLATITNCNIDTVQVAIKMFVELGLMEKWDNGTLFMLETQNMIGSETQAAERMRRMRDKKRNNVTQELQQVTKRYTDTDTELDIELDTELHTDTKIEIEKTEQTKRDSELLLCFYNYKLENAKDKLKLRAWLDKQFKDKNTSVIKEFEDFKKNYRSEQAVEKLENFDVDNLHPRTLKLLEKVEITKLETTSSSLIVWERGGLKNEYSIDEITKLDKKIKKEVKAYHL